jgi:integrase
MPGTVAPSTLQQYTDVIRLYIKPSVGRKRLATLNARDVAGMINRLRDEGRAPNTIRLARSVLRRALRWAEAEGTVTRNVAAVAFGVKVPAPRGRTMTPDEARAFLASVHGHRLEAAWVVMLATGLRRGELLGLTWNDITLDTKPATIVVRRSLARLPDHGIHLSETKTATSARTVHLPAVAVKALREHRKRQATERLAAGAEWVARPLGADLVFRNPFGGALDPDHFRQNTYVVTEKAGIGRWSRTSSDTQRQA